MESFIDLLTPTEIELTWWKVAALLAAGVLGGFINTVAGGASMITVPLLILLGMPADYANGTNRVGILQQSIVAIAGFNRRGKLDKSAVLPCLRPRWWVPCSARWPRAGWIPASSNPCC